MAICASQARWALRFSRSLYKSSTTSSRWSRVFSTQPPRVLPNQRPQARVKTFTKASRAFSNGRSLGNTTQEAPNTKAFIESGVISGARNLVDVSKVLVIGSGGLSIGQAGEFDYSGRASALRSTLRKLQLLIPTEVYRFTGTQGSQRSWRPIRPDKSQHRNHPDSTCSCRRSLLPPRHS